MKLSYRPIVLFENTTFINCDQAITASDSSPFDIRLSNTTIKNCGSAVVVHKADELLEELGFPTTANRFHVAALLGLLISGVAVNADDISLQRTIDHVPVIKPINFLVVSQDSRGKLIAMARSDRAEHCVRELMAGNPRAGGFVFG